tara:strand:+ start:99 stop:422 length:324 start_codon:yes stop_codon:yes gene_type:complete
LVPLNKLIFFAFLSLSIQAKDLNLECENIKKAEDTHGLIIKYQKKQFMFKENVYLFNSHRENEIFAQRRTIFLNSFLEFNEKTYMLIEVNSWIHKITKNEFICKVVN